MIFDVRRGSRDTQGNSRPSRTANRRSDANTTRIRRNRRGVGGEQ